MKKFIVTFTATTIFTLSTLFVNAQAIAKSTSDEIKKALASPDETAGTEVSNKNKIPANISFKAVRDFATTYPHVENENWENTNEGFVVRFVSNSVRNMNYYDKKGNWMFSMQLYNESKLPKDTRATVKISYYDYTITSVQEINMKKNNSEPIYLIHIKNGTTNKTLRISENEMEEVKL